MNKILVEICVGTSCYILGAQDILNAVETLPADKKAKLELRGVTCLKNCGKGPNARIDGVIIQGASPKKVIEVIEAKLSQA